MYANVMVTRDLVNLQILNSAHDSCITLLPGNKGPEALRKTVPQVLCAVSVPHIFLAEGQGRTYSEVVIEDVLKNDTCMTIVSFVVAPFIISPGELASVLKESNPGAQMTLELLKRSQVKLSVHFDFLFHPAFRNRPDFLEVCRQSEGLDFCLCKSARLWTKKSGPILLHRQKFEPSQMMRDVRSTISLPDDCSLVL